MPTSLVGATLFGAVGAMLSDARRWRRLQNLLISVPCARQDLLTSHTRSSFSLSNRIGKDHALQSGMAKHVSELVVWQLADEMRRHVFSWTGRPPFANDFKARGQIDDAVNSVCRNVSEGFGGTHKEFANYLRIARRSLNEVLDCTRAAQMKRYITASEAAQIYSLARRLFPALKEFIAYLERTPDPPSQRRSDKRRRPKRPPQPPGTSM